MDTTLQSIIEIALQQGIWAALPPLATRPPTGWPFPRIDTTDI